jgi:hypothetical protein
LNGLNGAKDGRIGVAGVEGDAIELEISLRPADSWRQRHSAKQDRLGEIHGVFFQLGVSVEVLAFAP